MLKANFRVRPELTLEIECKEQKNLFEDIASIQEVFENQSCTLCTQHGPVRFVVRTVEEDLYYEYRCDSCGARLNLSVNKKGGTLYVVRKLKDGMPAKVTDTPPFDFRTKGWYKFDKTKLDAKKASQKDT